MTDAPATPPAGGAYRGPPLEDILLEHLEELAFLGIQRRKLLFAHDVPLFDFEPHDERIAAHWDGLVIGGDAAVELARTRITTSDPWDVFAAARVWVELGLPGPDEVFDAIDAAKDEASMGWRAALRACDASILADMAAPALASSSTAVQAAFTYALGWHGLLPSKEVAALAASQDAEVRRSVARALGWDDTRDGAMRRVSASLVTDPDPAVRAAALWSAALINPGGAVQWCRDRATDGPCDPFHIRIIGVLGGPQDSEILQAFAESDDERRVAGVFALGDLGCADSLTPLKAWAGGNDPELAEAALTAIEMILDDTPPGSSGEGAGSEEGAEESEGAESEEEWWARMMDRLRSEARMLRGAAFPWRGEPARQPMAFLWRSLIAEPGGEPAWLRREVPDGFFSGLPTDEAIPGE